MGWVRGEIGVEGVVGLVVMCPFWCFDPAFYRKMFI